MRLFNRHKGEKVIFLDGGFMCSGKALKLARKKGIRFPGYYTYVKMKILDFKQLLMEKNIECPIIRECDHKYSGECKNCKCNKNKEDDN